MARIQLRDLCGVRSGDKGDISDLALFADTDAAYEAILAEVTADKVKAHFGDLVLGPVERYEARNVLALKFVLHDASAAGRPGRCGRTTSARRSGPPCCGWSSRSRRRRRHGQPPARPDPPLTSSADSLWLYRRHKTAPVVDVTSTTATALLTTARTTSARRPVTL